MFSQGYLIDTQLCVAALWLFYILLLHRRISLSAARTYLLCLFPVGMLLPLLRIPLLPAVSTPDREQIVYIQMDTPSEMPVVETLPTITFTDILLYIYLLGAAVMLIVAGIGIWRTWIRVRRAKQAVVFSPVVAGAYSAFGTIFVNDKYEGSPLLGQILAHEQSHIDHHHTADLIWLNLWRSLLWFNPLAWHSVKLLREVHEFQADQAVIRSGYPAGPYIELLIGTEAGIYPGTANALCYSLTKKRLKMIAQTARGRNHNGYLRIALLLPITGLLLGAFSLTARAATPSEPDAPQPALTETLPADTIREVTVQVKRILDTLDLDVRPIPKAYVDGKEVKSLDLDVQPDTAKQSARVITIRGNSDPNQQPIFVIDGVISTTNPLSPGPNEINANHYESVTVLKGSAATIAYGDRGKNGAIVITTKETYSGTLRTEDIREIPAATNSLQDSTIRKSLRNAASETKGHSSSLTLEEARAKHISVFVSGTPSLALTKGQLAYIGWRKGNSSLPASQYSNGTATVYLSKEEQEIGANLATKLLRDLPEHFYLEDNWVRNREPVRVRVYKE